MVMMMANTDQKISLAVMFGGRSGEHEVSLMSARSVLAVLDPERYSVTQIAITRAGRWLIGEDAIGVLTRGKTDGLEKVFLSTDPSEPGLFVIRNSQYQKLKDIDVFFPVMHGTFSEDGSLQGMLEMANVAYVGAGVVGSATGMDKGIFKDVMVANEIPVVETIVVSRSEIEQTMEAVIRKAEQISDYPLFTKPANLGSSVGVTKCNNPSDLREGLIEAASFDRRVLVQRGIKNAREIEVSVLGNENPLASIPGEVQPSRDFYSYESKYVDGTSGLLIPAPLSLELSNYIQATAVRAYQAIDCAGMARVDFLLEKDSDAIYLNEVNTIPGFTQISMYPKLWEASGLPYQKLVDRLVELALERKTQRDQIKHEYRSQA